MTAVMRSATLPLAAAGIVAGGLLLGAALGSFANPVPKTPGDPPWAGLLHAQAATDNPDIYYASQTATSTPNLPDSYPQPQATRQLAWWPADLKLPRDGEYKLAPLPSTRDDARLNDPPADTFADRDVDVPHYAAIERAAQNAQDTALDAAKAQPQQGDADAQDAQAPSAGRPKVIYVAEQADR